MWFMEEPSKFSMGETAQILICSLMEKRHTGSEDCLNMLLACFIKRMSDEGPPESALVTSTKPVNVVGCPPPKKCIKLEAERIAAMVSKMSCPELMGSLKLDNVWFFVQLIRNLVHLTKNPNIALLETSYLHWSCRTVHPGCKVHCFSEQNVTIQTK